MKQKTVFLCNECGYESPKWYGKCPSCGAWNSMDEFKEAKPRRRRAASCQRPNANATNRWKLEKLKPMRRLDFVPVFRN